MHEVSQNVDISLNVDALFNKFDKLLALNTLPTNFPNMQDVNDELIEETLPLMCSKDYTSIEKENLICTENVNSNLACIALPENSSWIGDGLMFYICYDSCMTYT
ncbi:hypothetical protein M9H77_26027 [Catharanthus roseus]|uniref:Uncharacterized protein n=1 Tax=Catharanthus roseus TaxID=4058 RepID=A0ACC0A8T1_CATRO|nr:hypothetical protein M9H77_26027 [Catharanthus roseus]